MRIFIITLLCDLFVIYCKVSNFQNVFAQNFIKIYFIFTAILAFFIAFASVFFIIAFSSKTYTISDSGKEIKKLTIKRSKIQLAISCLIAISFGVVGCWGFFTVCSIYCLSTIILIYYAKKFLARIKEEHPEYFKDEEQKQRKVDTKAKFRFLNAKRKN